MTVCEVHGPHRPDCPDPCVHDACADGGCDLDPTCGRCVAGTDPNHRHGQEG